MPKIILSVHCTYGQAHCTELRNLKYSRKRAIIFNAYKLIYEIVLTTVLQYAQTFILFCYQLDLYCKIKVHTHLFI